MGNVPVKNIEEVADEIVESPFKMKVVGIDPIESTYYNGTIISLGLQKTDDFLYCQEFLKETLSDDENVKIKEYRGGFITHVSLFVIRGLQDDQKELISRYLELCLLDLGGTEVFGEKFCIYNPDRVKVVERYFKPG